MEKNKGAKAKTGFSFYEITKPKFDSKQIQISIVGPKNSAGLPKPLQKLTVGRTGKIGFSK